MSTILARLEHRCPVLPAPHRLPLSFLLFLPKGFFYLRTISALLSSISYSWSAWSLRRVSSWGTWGHSAAQRRELRHSSRQSFYFSATVWERALLSLSFLLSLSLSFFLFVSVSPFFSFCFSFFRILSVHRASLGVLLFCPTLSVYSRFSSLWILHPRRSLSYPPVWRLVRARPMDGDAGVLAWYPMVAMLRSTEGVQKVRGNCTTQLGRCRTSLRPNKILTALCPNPRNCPSFRTRSFTIARNDLSLYFRNSRHKLRVHVQIKSGYFLSKEIFNFGRAKWHVRL